MSLTVGSVEIDSPAPYAVLQASDEKNRKGSEIPLRADLADDLRLWLTEKREAFCKSEGETIGVLSLTTGEPVMLPTDTPLLNVPKQLVKALDRDLAFTGIAKVDDRGRTLDVHALRHSFGSLLSAGGVAPRTAQAAMRHSSIDLTMTSTPTRDCSMYTVPWMRCRNCHSTNRHKPTTANEQPAPTTLQPSEWLHQRLHPGD